MSYVYCWQHLGSASPPSRENYHICAVLPTVNVAHTAPPTNAFPTPRPKQLTFYKKLSLVQPVAKTRREASHRSTPQRMQPDYSQVPSVVLESTVRTAPQARMLPERDMAKANATLEPGGIHYKEITIDSAISNDEVRTPLSLFRPFYNTNQLRRDQNHIVIGGPPITNKKTGGERAHEGVINGHFEHIVTQRINYGNRLMEKHRNKAQNVQIQMRVNKNFLPVKRKDQ